MTTAVALDARPYSGGQRDTESASTFLFVRYDIIAEREVLRKPVTGSHHQSARHVLESIRFSLVSVVIVLAGITHALAAPPSLEHIQALNAVSLDHESPHTKWARPYARGPIRVLFITALNSDVNIAATREAVELVQRFDIAADAVLVTPAKGKAYAVAYTGESGVFGGKHGERRLARHVTACGRQFDYILCSDRIPVPTAG